MAALLRKVTHSWYYGKRIVEAVYNIETVFLHQNEVIGHGKELCHHLPVCVVGAAEAGKTSLIRKLTDQPFVKVHEPTEILDTTTVEPVLVSQQYVEAKTWRTVKEKTDTDDLIAFRVNSTLKEAAAADRGSSIPLYFMRFFLFFLLVESTCFYSLSYGARPLANIGLCAMYGFCLLGRSDTGLRLGLGFTTMAYGVTWPAAEALVRSCDGGSCTQQEYVSIIFPFLLRPVLWGFAVAYGLVPGMASGLAIIQLASTAADKCTILDQIYPGTQNLLLSWEFDSSVAAYWLFTFILAFVEFLIINKNHTMAAVKVMPVCILGVLLVSQYFLGVINISLAFLYPITMMMMHTVGVCFMSIGHKFGPVQNPAGLLKIDLIKNFCEAHVPGTLLGVFAGTCILGGEISHIIQTMDSFFVTAAILVFVFILPKLSVIHLYFTQPNDGERESQNAEQAKLSGKLHQCFKLLVRDFAGQMVYHCLHQPFLPKFGIFVCTFSWTQARKYSLKHAEGVNQPEDGPDVCLNEILFWLKNISMHRLHPINQVDSSPDTANAMDQQNIKNIFLAATHHSYESCGLDENQKAKIMAYYKSKLSGYRDIYTCINFDVSPAGVISLENSNDQSEGGIEVLKKNVLQTAEKVIRHCFPVPVPVYFWCWLKERRDHFEKANIPPCETLLQSRQELDARGRYMTVYPKNTFCKMLNTFCNIGEIFLVQNKDSGHGKAGDDLDYFIFFDIQFLIDFMKDIVKIDNKKTTDRLMAEDWESLRRRGTAPTALLRHHLQRFYETKGMTQVYADHPLERQPLVRSMLQLDFMFFVGDHFFLPQLLPKYNIQENHPDYFSEVGQIQWELVFDFKDFEFHHEYVFFRVLAKCANLYSYEKRAVFKDWASFGEEQKQIPIQGDRVRQSEEQNWFTLSCEKRGSDDGEYNRIYLRTHLDFNREKSLGVMKNVTNAVTTITTESFAKLGGKLSTFFNCPNRTNLKNAHKIADYQGAHRSSTHRLDKVVTFDCGDECNHNQETHVVRLDPDGIPYKAVSQGVKDWLCTNLDERQFKALLSYLLNMNIAHLEKQFKVRARGRDLSSRNVCEEVKTGLLDQWTEGYDASLNSLCGALDTLELSDTRSVLVTRFPQ